jgi:hypothetical protein
MTNGELQVSVYRLVSYRGLTFQQYMPAVYFQPKFYSWVASPWAAPVPYAWGWNAEPWFGFYSGYFTPELVYSGAAMWLTDSVLASSLSDAYADQQTVASRSTIPQSDAQQAVISPAVKLAIAEEVRQQIASEQADSTKKPQETAPSNGSPVALNPAQRVFVVSSSLDVFTASGTTCTLTGGDIIRRTGDTMGAGNLVAVTVLSSKPGDCPATTAASVHAVALQKMHNVFRQKLDSGLATYAKKQGTGGLPAGPPAGAFGSKDGQGKPDSSSEAALIYQQQLAANQAEVEAGAAANSAG